MIPVAFITGFSEDCIRFSYFLKTFEIRVCSSKLSIFLFNISTLRFSKTSFVIFVIKVFDNPSKALFVINLSTFGMDFSNIIDLLYYFKEYYYTILTFMEGLCIW